MRFVGGIWLAGLARVGVLNFVHQHFTIHQGRFRLSWRPDWGKPKHQHYAGNIASRGWREEEARVVGRGVGVIGGKYVASVVSVVSVVCGGCRGWRGCRLDLVLSSVIAGGTCMAACTFSADSSKYI